MPYIREPLINAGDAAHSERAIRKFSMALRCETFDVRCLHDTDGNCTFNEPSMSLDALCRVIPKLRHRNANGSGVFIRPCLPFALADDVPLGTIDRILDDGYRIAAVIETSPASHQVWIPLAGPLQTVEQETCAAANERLVELYGTDPGVVHRDSFGRAPGFRNRKPEHDHDGITPLVIVSNRLSGFRGYDRVLLEEARHLATNNHQLSDQRSVGAVPNVNPDVTDPTSAYDHDPIEITDHGEPVVTFSAVLTDDLFDTWLTNMMRSGYRLPLKPRSDEVDRSQRDLDVARRMQKAGVPRHTAQAALMAGSDKAQGRNAAKYSQHVVSAVWGKP